MHHDYAQQLYKRYKAGKRLSDHRKGHSGRPPIMTEDVVRNVEEVLRGHGYQITYEELAQETGVTKSTLQRYGKQNWRKVKRRIIPLLTDKHKAARIEYAKKWKGKPRNRHVHIDEKWFSCWRQATDLKLPRGKKAKPKKQVSRTHPTKVMVLSALARPNQKHGFDGKLGIWRYYELVETKRRSKNREAGRLMKKDVSVNSDNFQKMLTGKVAKAIRKKMKWADKVFIQWDNARAHSLKGENLKKVEKCFGRKEHKPRICVVSQPAMSPDTNVNDLGFFYSMEKSMPKVRCFHPDDLEEQITETYNDYPEEKIHKLFDSARRVLPKIIECGGDIDYEMPHSRDEAD